MRIDPGPTCPVKTTRGPLHALAVALGQSHPRNSAAQQTGSVCAVIAQIHPDSGNVAADSQPQSCQNDPTVWLSQSSSTPAGAHHRYSSPDLAATHMHPDQTHDVYSRPPDSVVTAKPLIQKTSLVEPQNKVQQSQRPFPTQPKLTPRNPRTEKTRRTSDDGS
ncbi:unnamed protein product, partial [Prunus brigantina]